MKIVYINLVISFCCLSSVLAQIQKKDIAKKGIAATVTIIALDADNDPFQFGSGFVFGNEMIATNFHVIEGCNSVLITTSLDTVRYYSNELVNFDKNNDIAILKVKSLSITSLSLSTDIVEIGDAIYVVGSPEGLESTFSEGIISSIRKYDNNKLIQITAPISHGSSGGPVINEKGEVIGISVATLGEGQSLNFAVPVEYLIKLKDTKAKSILLNSEKLKEMASIEKERPKIESKDLQMSLDYYNKGKAEKDLEKANEYFTKAIQIDPSCFNCYNERAINKYNLKDYEGTFDDYLKAFKLEKRDSLHLLILLQNLTWCRLGKTQIGYEVVISLLDSLIKEKPYLIFYQDRGKYKYKIGDYNGAIEDYKIVFEIGGYYDYDVLLWIAGCQYKLGKNDEAVKTYTKVIDMNPPNSTLFDTYQWRGNSKMELEDYRGALSDYKKALGYHIENYSIIPLTNLYNRLSRAKMALADFEGAFIDLNKALQLYDGASVSIDANGDFERDPGKAETYFLRGIAKFYLKNIEGACKDWSIAGEYGYPDAYDEIKKNCK